ncbi:P-loop NTPase fold protein [Bacillus sp. UNCCL81]|uniref:P-loop NTPase fold protein n=1 Tax=Bacillus sp. UNCCL81 TaxID=1502755 RepID=UPI0008EB266A|nr:P-loop NTPase fold protein [Bacillus sp. UNCCL81]SFC42137.1 AAA ATPase domain-containing protein [Bacillus sp. UNCCL81]
MKVYLKHYLISDSPYETGGQNDLFITQDKKLFEQVVLEIVNGNSASFLISGYRGAGKTSFINKIKEKSLEKESDMLFISLNFGKYEEFSMILRKIIREVYLAIDDKILISNNGKKNLPKKYKEKLEEDNSSLIRELELIYERTFYQITENRKDSLQIDKNISYKITHNIKKTVISVGLLIFAGIGKGVNIFEKMLGLNNTYLDWAVLLGTSLWAGFETFKLTLEYSKKRTELDELSRSSLYDNEIAEFQLRKILKRLKKSGLKLVFIIDELDKIDEEEKLNSLISELKPLMLSGIASFILISGQKLYYKYQASHTVDDAVISSIFSKTIHIPLLSVEKFETLFKTLLVEESDYANTLLQDYVNSNILQSNRLARRFINLIRQNLSWEEKTSFIDIDEKRANGFKTDTLLLGVIKEIEEENIKGEKFANGIKDFLITQLHIWIQKIKLNRYVSFTINDIYDLEQYSKELHSSWYLTILNNLSLKLLDNLVGKGLLEKESKEIEEETKFFYKWKDDFEVIVDEGIKQDDVKWIFMDNFVKVEKMTRKIYHELIQSGILHVNRRNVSFWIMISELKKNGILELRKIEELAIRVNSLKSKISHGEDLNESDMTFMLLNSNQALNKVGTTIIEQLFYYFIQKYTNETNFKSHQMEKNKPFKFLCIDESINLHICFKIILLKKDFSFSNYIRITLSNFKNYISKNPKSHLVFFIYSEEDIIYQEKFKSSFEHHIKEYSDLREHICYYYYNDLNINQLNEDLAQVLHNHLEVLQ